MKLRLTRWAYSPRTPQRLAHAAVELGLLLAAIGGMIAVVTGWAPHLIASGLVDAAAQLGGVR